MNFTIDLLRTSANVRNSLTRIKTITGIPNWNVICRWAFCLSLKQTSLPREVDEKLDGIEIDYDTLVGKNKSIYTQLLINNLITHKVEIDKKNLTKYLYAHVNRGVNIIYTNKLKDISGLFKLI